jgi:hypothetical protein
MSNKRITDLVDIVTASPDDVLEIVKVSDNTESPEGSSYKVKVSELGGTPQGLQSVLEVDPLAEFDGGNVSIKIDADSLEATYSDGASNKSELQLYPDGTFYSGSERLIESGTKQLNIYNTLETWFSELATNLGVIIRRSFIQFLENGVKISSRTNTDEIGVIHDHDNLTVDRTRQEQDKDGTYALLQIPHSGGDGISRLQVFDNLGNFSNLGVAGADAIFQTSYASSKGIIGSQDFSANYTDLTYVQKKWVDDNFAKYGTTAPESATSTGTVGEIRFTSTYIYTCHATNQWRRVAVSTW